MAPLSVSSVQRHKDLLKSWRLSRCKKPEIRTVSISPRIDLCRLHFISFDLRCCVSPSIRMERSRWSKSSWASQRNGQEQVRKWRTRLWQTSRIFSSHCRLLLHLFVQTTMIVLVLSYFLLESDEWWRLMHVVFAFATLKNTRTIVPASNCKQHDYEKYMIALVWRPARVMRTTIQTTRPAAQSAQCHWSVMSCRCVCHCVEKCFGFLWLIFPYVVSPCHVIVMSLLLRVVACPCFLIAQVYMMSKSGARGNISQVRQLVAMRGLMADAKGISEFWVHVHYISTYFENVQNCSCLHSW